MESRLDHKFNINLNGDKTAVFDIPKMGKAAIVINEGPGYSVEVTEVPVPEPAPDQLLLRLNATGICHSDIHFMKNDWKNRKMSQFGVRSPGHEGAGIVVKIGSDAGDRWKLGDRVGLKPLWNTCGSCELCLGDLEAYCAKSQFTGLLQAGSYQQYVLSPARYTTRIPEGVDDFIAAPLMCSGVTVYRALVEARLKPNDWAVILGAGGGVGIQGIQLAKAMGLRPIAVDSGDKKRVLCMAMGAEKYVDFAKSSDVSKDVVSIADGIGAHGVFVIAPQAYHIAIDVVGKRIGATICCLGLPPAGSNPLTISPSLLAHRNLKITGSLAGSMKDTDETLEFARR
ncbi:alcohol dehydrogenase, partial [Lachnellula suecica]